MSVSSRNLDAFSQPSGAPKDIARPQKLGPKSTPMDLQRESENGPSSLEKTGAGHFVSASLGMCNINT